VLKNPELKDLTIQGLIVIQGAGIEADNFLRLNEFYTRRLKPELDAQREQAKADGEWNPTKTTDTEAVALFNAYNSGLRRGLAGIETACRRLMVKGENASKELERRHKAEKAKTI
jgi:hypothetical protein